MNNEPLSFDSISDSSSHTASSVFDRSHTSEDKIGRGTDVLSVETARGVDEGESGFVIVSESPVVVSRAVSPVPTVAVVGGGVGVVDENDRIESPRTLMFKTLVSVFGKPGAVFIVAVAGIWVLYKGNYFSL